MVKIIDKTDPRKRENKVFQSMLEKAVMVFGADCVKQSNVVPFGIDIYDGNKENPQIVAGINLAFSKITLYDSSPLYLKNLKKLASYYELMEGREVRARKERLQ